MTTREKLLSELDNLSDEQIENVLTFVETLKTQSPRPEYDESKDPAIGFFSASSDLSSRKFSY